MFRAESETLPYGIFVVYDRVVQSFAERIHLHARSVHKLQSVEVARCYHRLDIRALRKLVHYRSQKVIRFKLWYLVNRNSKGLEHLARPDELCDERIFRLRARRFIALVCLVPVRRLRQVEAGRDIIGFQVVGYLIYHRYKTVQGAGRLAFG